MECRRAVINGGVLRSPPSASAAPLTIAANSNVMRHHRDRRHSRPYTCGDDIVDEYNNNNNNNRNVTAVTTINNTTHLIDELEQLRTDNFQLRLRVYNAERRVDRLSAAALARDRKRSSDSTDTDSGDSDASSGHAGIGTDHNNAAAKATAEAAVRTIHDLLTVNRRLLALLAATVSQTKAVSVSTDDKRRWQRLRNHIEEYAVDGPNEEKTNVYDDYNDDEFHDATATDSETSCKAPVLSAERSVTRHKVLRSPPPPPQPQPSTPLETPDDEGAGSEVSRLRGRCRRLERSLQQLVNTELWARNRQIGKLEQQRYVTQVADAAAQRDRRPGEQAVAAAVAAPLQHHHLQQFLSKTAASATKGILVKRSVADTSCAAKSPAAVCTKSLTAVASSPPKVATITTPPPVLPDYSEVNFFFSCDEEDDDDDDDHDLREDSAETNCTSSSEEETVDSNNCKGEEEPVRLAVVGTPVASSTSKRKRHCRPHHRQMQQPIKSVGDSATVTTTTSSSTESAAAEDEADELNGDGVIMTTTTTTATSPCTTRRHRTVSGGGGLHRRRRCRPPRRCSTCGRCSGSVDAATAMADRPRLPSVADAQVQCGGGNVGVDHGCNSGRGDGELQLHQLRRELDARRRENGRLYDMLLRLQRGTQSGDRGKGDGGPEIPSPDFSDSDPCDSPKPYRQAAGVVRGHIADLLPPLLSMRSISDDDGGDRSIQRYRPDGAEQQQQQQQQQLQLLTRLRERIVAYERRELDGGDDRAAAVVQQSAQPRSADLSDDVVRRMDRTDLVNVALPRVVERLRRALVPLLQHRPENAVAAASVRGGSVNGGGDFVVDGVRSPPPSGER